MIFTFLICFLFGPAMTFTLAYSPNSHWKSLPFFVQLGIGFLSAACYSGCYAALFIHPRIVFDCLSGDIEFYNFHFPFYTVHKEQVTDFTIQTVPRSDMSNNVRKHWTGYIVYARLTDGKELPLAETSDPKAADNFLGAIKESYWR